MKYSGIKFKVNYHKKEYSDDLRIDELIYWCRIFHEQGLAPPYPGGSYGNLSFRVESEKLPFLITASRIGLKNDLDKHSFVLILNCDLSAKTVTVSGNREPSSETLLHYAIYKQRPEIGAVFHGHCSLLLEKAKELNLSITAEKAEYGTLELINTVLCCLEQENFLILKDHGFLSLGKDMQEAGELSLQHLKKCK